MFSYKNRLKKAAIGMSLAAMLAVGAAVPALADDTVTGEINAGIRTAIIADLDLDAVDYSHADQNILDTMVLTVDDSTGTGDGWNVTVQAGDFELDGDVGTTNDIAASNFVLDSNAIPVMTAGQAINVTAGNGPEVGLAVTGSLDAARKVIFAGIGYGQGTYTQNLGVTLTVPGYSRAGTYTSTLVVTNGAGPGA